MIVLSKGYKLPQTGDKGSVWFPALEDDITQLNAHNHDGTNSEPIPGGSIIPSITNIAASDWVAFGSGYRVLVTLPTGYLFEGTHKEFRLVGSPQDGAIVNPTIEKIDNTSFYVYSNLNTIDLLVSIK